MRARAPAANEFVERWIAEFGRIVRDAAGSDGLLQLEEACQLRKNAPPARSYADAAIRYLEATEEGPNALVNLDELVADRFAWAMAAAADVAIDGRLPSRAARWLPDPLIGGYEALQGVTVPAVQGFRLAQRFATLAEGLVYVSESDSPYQAYSARIPPSAALTADAFRRAMAIGPRVEIAIESADTFFQEQKDLMTSEDYGLEPADAQTQVARYTRLERAMSRTLRDLSLVQVGGQRVVEGQIYIVGRARDGGLAGLRTIRIWT